MGKERVSKFQIWVTIGGFLLILFVPSVAWIFCYEIIGDETSENRKLAEMPEIKIEKILDFSDGFEVFWNDHLPFRKNMRVAWTNLNHFVLHDSPSEMVVLGKDGGEGDRMRWLFYNGEDEASPMKDTQGITSYTNEMKEVASRVLQDNEKYLKGKRIDFYLLMIPHKEDVYREYLPDNVGIYKEKSRDEDLVEYLQETHENVIFAKDEIMNAKGVGQLYYRDDTHWNMLGGFYGFKAFMNKAVPGFKDFDYELVWSEPQVCNFDLPMLMNIQDYYMDRLPTVTYMASSMYEENKTADGVMEQINKKASINKTIMIVGDSYRSAMLPYFGKVFAKVISVHRDDYKPEMLDEYKPNIVVNEVVERFGFSGGAFLFGA